MVNLRRRALFKPVAAGGLPAGYRQVAWINGNSKTKMPLTDWGIERPFDIELGVNLVVHTGFVNYLFSGDLGQIGWCSNKKANATGGYGNAIFNLDTDYTITAQFREDDADCGYLVDGNSAGTKPTNDTSAQATYFSTPTIFGRYGDYSYRGSFKLYYFKVYDTNGNLTHDCIPCVDANNNPCIYDTINKRTAYFLTDNSNDASFATYGELTT